MYATVNGIRLFFDTGGSGYVSDSDAMLVKPACVVLHGGGIDHAYLRPWLAPLAETMQLIYVDLRGHGRSGRASTDSYNFEQFADDIEALRQYLGLGAVIVLGHSLGSFTAQAYVSRYPDSVDKLILVEAAPSAGFAEEANRVFDAKASATQKEWMPRLFEGRLETEAAHREWWQVMLPLYFHRPDPRVCEELVAQFTTTRHVGNYLFATQVPSWDVRDRLPRLVATDVLVVVGRHDWVTPPSQAELIRELIPTAELAVFEESGHFPFVEEHEQFLNVVRDFVAGYPASR